LKKMEKEFFTVEIKDDEVDMTYRDYNTILEPSEDQGGLYLGNIKIANDTYLLRKGKNHRRS